ncbi:FecCD family ABC transporter permease [Cohnella faecalis]
MIRKPFAAPVVMLLLCAASVVASAALGKMALSPLEAIRGLLGIGAEDHEMVIRNLRLPRILVALLAGASLAASGAVLQGMIRNPMASPDVLGVTGGASSAAVCFLSYFAGTVSIRFLPVAAMLGAAIVTVALYSLAWKRGVTPLRLVLVGVGLSAILSGITTMMVLFNPRNEADQAYVWLTGSVYGANWENVLTILPWTVILLPLAFAYARHIDIVQLGDETATGSGSRVQFNRFLLLCVSVGLAGSAVSVAGGLSFVGLIAPHMARKLMGPSFGKMFPVSVLLGAIVVVLADLAGRMLFQPLDVPAGVFTAGVGAPFFIYLLYSKRNSI